MGSLPPISRFLDPRKLFQQECIPVGCVPADRRPYAGVRFPGGGFSIRGGSPSRGGFLHPAGGGSSIQPGGVLHPAGGGSSIQPGGFLHPARGGSSIQPGLLARPPPPPVNRMTDRCKNITLAKTSFRPETMKFRVLILNCSQKVLPRPSCHKYWLLKCYSFLMLLKK